MSSSAPRPLSDTVCGLPGPESVNVSEAGNPPYAGGVKLTCTVQVPPEPATAWPLQPSVLIE